MGIDEIARSSGWVFVNGHLVSTVDQDLLMREITDCMESGEYERIFRSAANLQGNVFYPVCSLYLPCDPVICPYHGPLVRVFVPNEPEELATVRELYMFACNRRLYEDE